MLLGLFCLHGLALAPPAVHSQGNPGRGVMAGDEFQQRALPARQTGCCVRPCDQLWVLNSRGQSSGCGCGDVVVSQFEQNHYVGRTLEDLAAEIAANPGLPSVIYVHGNFTDFGWSLQRGCEVYRSLFGDCASPGPVRFVIWSWKTEREALPPADYGIKVSRAVEEGKRLLETLNRTGVRQPLVVGYSLGCQVILSALTQPSCPPDCPWQICLMAPALDCGFQQQLCQEPLTADRIDGIDVFTNSRDCALRYARLRCTVSSCSLRPFDQFAMVPLLAQGGVPLQVLEVSGEVGRRHSIKRYRSSCSIVSVIRQRFDELPVSSTGDPPPSHPQPAAEPPLEPEPPVNPAPLLEPRPATEGLPQSATSAAEPPAQR